MTTSLSEIIQLSRTSCTNIAGGTNVGGRSLTQAEAARVVGVQRQAVNIWLKRYRAEGDDGVLDGRRISPCRGKAVLTEAKAKQVGAWIVDTEGCASIVFSQIS